MLAFVIRMRFDTKVNFYAQGKYEPKIGYTDDKLVDTVLANVTSVGLETSIKLFGKLSIDKKVARLQRPVKNVWTYCVINDTKYSPDTVLNGLKSLTLVLSETK